MNKQDKQVSEGMERMREMSGERTSEGLCVCCKINKTPKRSTVCSDCVKNAVEHKHSPSPIEWR